MSSPSRSLLVLVLGVLVTGCAIPLHGASRARDASVPPSHVARPAPDAPLSDDGLALGGALDTRPQDQDAAEEGSWTYVFAPYLWTTNLSGHVKVGGRKANVDESFSDILKNMDYGVLTHFAASNGEWGWGVDVVHMVISADESSPVGKVDTKLTHGFAEAHVSQNLDADPSIEVLAGVRRVYVKTRVEIGRTFRQSVDARWTDPIVGVRKTWQIDDQWRALFRADVGGFGINDSSDLAYQGVARVSYDVNDALAWTVGYRFLAMDYDGSSYEHDLKYQAMVAGAEFRF
jgi:opacity protein-like surface antigen